MEIACNSVLKDVKTIQKIGKKKISEIVQPTRA